MTNNTRRLSNPKGRLPRITSSDEVENRTEWLICPRRQYIVIAERDEFDRVVVPGILR